MRPLLWAVCTIISLIPACQLQEDCKDDQGIAQVSVDLAFTEMEQASIFRAADRWNTFANHLVLVVRVTGGNHITCTVFYSTKDDLGDGRNWQGVEHGATGNIEIARSLSCNGEERSRWLPCFEAIVMHEMGHLLGLSHLPPGAKGIMQGIGAALDFSEADRRVCEDMGVCR